MRTALLPFLALILVVVPRAAHAAHMDFSTLLANTRWSVNASSGADFMAGPTNVEEGNGYPIGEPIVTSSFVDPTFGGAGSSLAALERIASPTSILLSEWAAARGRVDRTGAEGGGGGGESGLGFMPFEVLPDTGEHIGDTLHVTAQLWFDAIGIDYSITDAQITGGPGQRIVVNFLDPNAPPLLPGSAISIPFDIELGQLYWMDFSATAVASTQNGPDYFLTALDMSMFVSLGNDTVPEPVTMLPPAVPEPSMATLAVIGLCGILAAMKLRFSRSTAGE